MGPRVSLVPGVVALATSLIGATVQLWFVRNVGLWAIVAYIGLAGIEIAAIAHYIAVDRRYIVKQQAVAEQAQRLEIVAKELVEHEALMRDDLVRAQRDLNERIVRLSGLLEATRQLVATRNLQDALQRIVDMTQAIAGSDGAMLELRDGEQTIRLSSGSFTEASASFELTSKIRSAGVEVGRLSVQFANVGHGAADTTHVLSIISAFAGVAVENARLYQDLRTANNSLDLSRKYAEKLVEEVPVGIVALDHDYRITTWNKALTGISQMPTSSAMGKHISDLLGPQADAVVRSLAKDSEKSQSAEMRTCTVSLPSAGTCGYQGDRGDDPDLGEHILRLVVSCVHSLDEDGVGIVIMAEDVTEKVRLGEQLRYAEKMKVVGEFAAGMAHEINNPIGIISACAEVMGKRLSRIGAGMEQFVKTAKIIEDEAIRCSSIIKNLLGFARQAEMNPGEVSIPELARETVDFLRDRADAANVNLTLDVAGDIPMVIADRNQIEQVFLNLAMNAMEAMKEGGNLRVAVVADSGSVRISFADTGPGVDQQSINRLFSPFFTTKPTGTGLGLALSHGIVERHGGRIEVENLPDAGALFTVVLSLSTQEWNGGGGLEIEKHLHSGEQNLLTPINP